MGVLLAVNLGIRFLLELCMLAALGYWGFKTGNAMVTKGLLGIGAPLIAAFVWGTFLSPKASIPLPAAGQLLLEAAVFGSAAFALHAAGRPHLALALFTAAVLNRLLMTMWKQ